MDFKQYKRKGLSEMRRYEKGEDLSKISVSATDDPENDMGMIARNPKNHEDQWYVAKKYFDDNLEEVNTINADPEVINEVIKISGVNTNEVSDGYHTFGELYDHRITLYIALLKSKVECWIKMDDRFREVKPQIWKTKAHSDGSVWDGWFILGMYKEAGEQITYHLPLDKWNDCWFAEELEKAPIWDNHTSQDVLNRISKL